MEAASAGMQVNEGAFVMWFKKTELVSCDRETIDTGNTPAQQSKVKKILSQKIEQCGFEFRMFPLKEFINSFVRFYIRRKMCVTCIYLHFDFSGSKLCTRRSQKYDLNPERKKKTDKENFQSSAPG